MSKTPTTDAAEIAVGCDDSCLDIRYYDTADKEIDQVDICRADVCRLLEGLLIRTIPHLDSGIFRDPDDAEKLLEEIRSALK